MKNKGPEWGRTHVPLVVVGFESPSCCWSIKLTEKKNFILSHKAKMHIFNYFNFTIKLLKLSASGLISIFLFSLLHKTPKSFNEVLSVVSVVSTTFKRRIVNNQPNQLVPYERYGIRFDQIEQVFKVRPTSFNTDEVNETLECCQTNVDKLA